MKTFWKTLGNSLSNPFRRTRVVFVFAVGCFVGLWGVVSCEGTGAIGDVPSMMHGQMGPVPDEGSGAGTAGGQAGVSATPSGGAGGAGEAPGAPSGGAAGTAGASGGATGPSMTDNTGAAGAAGNPGAAGATGTAGKSGGAGATGAAGRSGGAGAAGKSGGAGASGAGGMSSLPPVTLPHCKRGEAYQYNSLADLQTLSKGISWWYNWTTSPEKSAAGYATAGVEFVPMVWGGTPDPAAIEKQIPAGAKYILGFNEPNFGAQSHIPAAQAAALWPKIMQIAKDKNLKIGSPSPNYCAGDCNDTDPIHYLDTFFAACTGCQVDFIAAHWYACTGDALKNYLSKLKKYGKPIWLTEFSCMDQGDHSAAGEQAYMKTAVDILENDPMVFRYSWFTGRWPNPSGVSLLAAGSGQLTDLGNLYMTLPASNTCGP